MANFNRGLDRKFVDALNEEYAKNGWWKKLADDRELFAAIREDYINVYYRGCSLIKISWNNGCIEGRTHYKYLLRPDFDEQYIRVIDGEPDFQHNLRNMFVDSLEDVSSLKRAAARYAGGEKTGVHNITLSNANVIDVEIAFGVAGNDEDDPSAPRIDIAAIQMSDGKAKIVFFEAKQFSNSELRATEERTPKVLGQIENYRSLLIANREQVLDSYRCVCQNLHGLCGLRPKYGAQEEILKSISDGSIEFIVDTDPVLLVFGFDDDQRRGTVWRKHRERLEEKMNEGRKRKVFFRGESRKFTHGVSR